MLADIEDDKIDTVLVKDMSRVGRNYLQTGFYTEVYFKKKAIHFIAIDSHVDSARSDNIEFVPMLNVLNEMYLRDQSRKVVIGYHAKGMTGAPIMSTPCFGYVKDPEDRNRWLVEPRAAETVRRIFELAAEETNPYRITRILQSEKRLTPAAYFESQGLHTRTGKKSGITGPYDWNRATILNILNAQEYLGRTVNFKSGKASYQAKRKVNPAEKQAVFEHTHEAIVDLDTWNKAHAFISSRRQTQPFTQWPTSPFKGKVVCAKREKFKAEHGDGLSRLQKAVWLREKLIKSLGLASPLDKEQRAALKTERAQLEAEREALLPKLQEVKGELAELNRIRYWTRKVIPDALPRVSDGRVSVEDAMETAGNRKELEQVINDAEKNALRQSDDPLQTNQSEPIHLPAI